MKAKRDREYLQRKLSKHKTPDEYAAWKKRLDSEIPKVQKYFDKTKRIKRKIFQYMGEAIAVSILVYGLYQGCKYVSGKIERVIENDVIALEKNASNIINLRSLNQLPSDYAGIEAQIINDEINKLYNDNTININRFTGRLEKIKHDLKGNGLLYR